MILVIFCINRILLTGIFHSFQGSAHTRPALTPVEVLIAIHNIIPEKDGLALKKVWLPSFGIMYSLIIRVSNVLSFKFQITKRIIYVIELVQITRPGTYVLSFKVSNVLCSTF